MMAAKEMLKSYFVVTLLVSGIGSSCVPAQCFDCEKPANVSAVNGSSDVCTICTNSTCWKAQEIPLNCNKAEFKAHLKSNSGYSLDEGDQLILNCHHNLPPLVLMFEWQRNRQYIKHQNHSTLTQLMYTIAEGAYRCVVHSPCGNFTSDEKPVKVNGNFVPVLLLCGLCAVVLVLAMGASMKYKQNKEQAAQKRRQEERAKVLQMTSSMTLRND